MTVMSRDAADAWEAHAGWVRKLVRGMVRDEHLAEDLVQDALAAGLEAPRGSVREPRAWLRGVVRHLHAQEARRGKAQAEREGKIPPRGDAPSAAEVASRAELQRAVAKEVLTLPEPYREALLLRYFEDMPVRRIAAARDLDRRAVESRLRRGKEMLRTRLRDRLGDTWAASVLPLAAAPFAPFALFPVGAGAGGATALLMNAKQAALLLLGLLGLVLLVALGPRLLAPDDGDGTGGVLDDVTVAESEDTTTGSEPATVANGVATRETYADSGAASADPATGELDFALAYPGARFSVRVLQEDGVTPAPFADLRLLVDSPQDVEDFVRVINTSMVVRREVYERLGRTYRTDAEGRATLPLPGARWALLATQGRGLAEHKPGEQVRTTEVVMKLQQRRAVAVRVVRPDGTPAESVQVSAFWIDRDRRRDAYHQRTDAAGQVNFDLLARVDGQQVDWQIQVSHVEFPPLIETVPGATDEDAALEIRLPEGASIRFRFLGEDGELLPGRCVAWVTREDFDSVAEAAQLSDPLRRYTRSIRSSYEGTVTLECIPTKPPLLYAAYVDGYGETVRGRIPGDRADGEVLTIDIRPPPVSAAFIGTWERTANESWGETLGEAHFQLGNSIAQRGWRTDDDGRFLMECPQPREKSVTTCLVDLATPQPPVYGRIVVHQFADLPIPVGEFTDLGLLTTESAPLLVSGVVVDGAGKPVAGASIDLACERPFLYPIHENPKWGFQRVWTKRHMPLLYSDEAGRFEIRGRLAFERCRLEVFAPGHAELTQEFALGSSDVVLRLDTNGGLPFEVLTDVGCIDDVEVRVVPDRNPGPEPSNVNFVGFVQRDGSGRGRILDLNPSMIYELQALSRSTREVLATVGGLSLHRLQSQAGTDREVEAVTLDLRGKVYARTLELQLEAPLQNPMISLQILGALSVGLILDPDNTCLLTKKGTLSARIMAPGFEDAEFDISAPKTTVQLRQVKVVTFQLDGDLVGSPESYNVYLKDEKRAFGNMFDASGRARVEFARSGELLLELWHEGERVRLQGTDLDDGFQIRIPAGFAEEHSESRITVAPDS